MANTTKSSSRDEQTRISLVFHMDDPLERAAYELMSSKTGKKSRSRMVSQAILGMMYLNEEGILDVRTIQSIIDQTVKTYIAALPKGSIISVPEENTQTEQANATTTQQSEETAEKVEETEDDDWLDDSSMNDFIDMFPQNT